MKTQRPSTSKIVKKIGAKLKEFRKVQKLTQEDLAALLEISTTYTGELERGDTDPSLKTLEKIAATLNLPISELLAEETASEKNIWIIRLEKLLPKFNPKQLANLYELLISLLKKQ